ncbi:MAG: hypothetical protein ABFE07_13070 [Armatimonadia bacterium]
MERILWIGYVLDNQENCTTILCGGAEKRYLLYCSTGDISFPIYTVVLDLVNNDHFDFVTGYPVSPEKAKRMHLEGRKVRSTPHETK